ncbi:hypothetical protein ACI48D_23825 [Massilia sp. LXY-6]|uniref:hypothetical protein n=1 Tax=Massilia sp. LXY-6 TaxID=3379823 RepID=UPI003EE229A2
MDQVSTGQRRDDQRRHIVDLGVALQQLYGTISAVEFLRSRDIAAAVIARVLGEPERRRAPAA